MRVPSCSPTKERSGAAVRNAMTALRCVTLSATGPRARATAATASAITPATYVARPAPVRRDSARPGGAGSAAGEAPAVELLADARVRRLAQEGLRLRPEQDTLLHGAVRSLREVRHIGAVARVQVVQRGIGERL